ncbi:hypothetical protein PR048_004827 [Dryococelus australis]|uniref:Uncharacterized protein n=1 Tax=Dryococelus australis TaxID=614101 RepID=A0ABQ9I6H9_9NEOP|nr:hypothetical protein PR048_004827 [Dryococelus australis]
MRRDSMPYCLGECFSERGSRLRSEGVESLLSDCIRTDGLTLRLRQETRQMASVGKRRRWNQLRVRGDCVLRTVANVGGSERSRENPVDQRQRCRPARFQIAEIRKPPHTESNPVRIGEVNSALDGSGMRAKRIYDIFHRRRNDSSRPAVTLRRLNLLLGRRDQVVPSWLTKIQCRWPTSELRVKRGGYGAAPECKGEGSGIPQRNEKNPPTSGVIQHNSHIRKSGIDLAGNQTHVVGLRGAVVNAWRPSNSCGISMEATKPFRRERPLQAITRTARDRTVAVNSFGILVNRKKGLASRYAHFPVPTSRFVQDKRLSLQATRFISVARRIAKNDRKSLYNYWRRRPRSEDRCSTDVATLTRAERSGSNREILLYSRLRPTIHMRISLSEMIAMELAYSHLHGKRDGNSDDHDRGRKRQSRNYFAGKTWKTEVMTAEQESNLGTPDCESSVLLLRCFSYAQGRRLQLSIVCVVYFKHTMVAAYIIKQSNQFKSDVRVTWLTIFEIQVVSQRLLFVVNIAVTEHQYYVVSKVLKKSLFVFPRSPTELITYLFSNEASLLALSFSFAFFRRRLTTHLGSPLVDDLPIMNTVKYRVVSGVVWTNRTMVSEEFVWKKLLKIYLRVNVIKELVSKACLSACVCSLDDRMGLMSSNHVVTCQYDAIRLAHLYIIKQYGGKAEMLSLTADEWKVDRLD